MAYKDLRTLFHIDEAAHAREYAARFGAETTLHVNININGSPAFLVMAPELYSLSLKAARLDKEILALLTHLPQEATDSFMNSCLIDEIVITNGIEGVRSTRKEISDVLKDLRKTDKQGRFFGLVRKYFMLRAKQRVHLATCADIRALYDELVLHEVLAEDPKDKPDGVLFRKGPVSIVSPAQVEIHRGIVPEEAIIAALTEALALLGNDALPPLARIGAFHFLFGYAHPFYNGNGRMNRFISSYLLANEYESIVGLRLSHAVKSVLERYYKAFEACEHPLNRGDLTPFVLTFADVIVAAMEDTRNALRERQAMLNVCAECTVRMAKALQGKELVDLTERLVLGTLYSPYGSTVAELSEHFGLSRQTVYARLQPLKDAGLLMTERVGHQTYLRLDVRKLRELYG